MSWFMGVDGGGSTLRVVLTDSQLKIRVEYSAGTANPRLIGYSAAREVIQAAIHETCRRAGLQIEQITAVGIGVAGASVEHSRIWLYETLQPIMAGAHLALSSDFEIALIGALGRREGILILAGTGSAAYGRTADGRSARIGGWGYLLGDEGSGYWIGLQALKLLTQQADQRGWEFKPESLSGRIVQVVNVASASELLQWVYGAPEPPVRATAALAPLVMEAAEAGDGDAVQILQSAAQALCQMVYDLQSKLQAPELAVAWSGGLLSDDNALSRELCLRLGLPQRPIARYTPAIGAALLAQLSWKESLAHDRDDGTG